MKEDRMSEERHYHHHHHQGGIFWGLILVVFGVLFLLDRIGGLDFGTLIGTYWPVIIIILGVSILIGNGFRRPGAGLFFIVLGGLFLLNSLDLLAYDVWEYMWPVLIILVGLWILFRGVFRRAGGGGGDAGKFPEIHDSDIDVSCLLGGMKRRIESQNFRGGRVTAIMGGLELDFRGAGLDGGKATLDATAIMGAVDIFVPRDWRVVMHGTPILGGFDDKHPAVPDAEVKATLYVKGAAIMGAVTIKD
jgi:predicted membrane protein